MMKRQDVEKVELRMNTIRKSLKEDLEEFKKTLEKLEEKQLRKEAVDYIIPYLKSNISGLSMDIAWFERTVDRELRECFYHLKEQGVREESRNSF